MKKPLIGADFRPRSSGNFERGRDAKMRTVRNYIGGGFCSTAPDYLILLSTLGGITAFGLSGFVIGPIIAALCVAGWDMFATDFGETDAAP